MAVRTTQPEILPPDSATRTAARARQRLGGGGGAFRDENLDLLSRVLDTWFRVPGTNIRFGARRHHRIHSRNRRSARGHGQLHHRSRCLFSRRAADHYRAHGRQPCNRSGRGPGAGARQPLRHRLAGQPQELSSAGAQPRPLPRRDTARDWLFMGLLGLGLLHPRHAPVPSAAMAGRIAAALFASTRLALS